MGNNLKKSIYKKIKVYDKKLLTCDYNWITSR